MKFLRALLLGLLLTGSAFGAQIQAVGVNGGSGNVGVTITASLSGSTIEVFADNSGPNAFTTVTDNKSNTYTAGAARSGGGLAAWQCIGATAGVTTVTVTGSGATHQTIIVIEESGITTLDQNPAVTNNGGGSTDTATAITTTSANEVAYFYMGSSSGDLGASTSWTPDTGAGGGTWSFVTGTGISAGIVNSTGNTGIFVMRMVLTSTASAYAAHIAVGVGNSWASGIMTFATSGGGGPTPFSSMLFSAAVPPRISVARGSGQ